MNKIKVIVLSILLCVNLYANEENANIPNNPNMDKLDILDKQSKEFFNAITGLEKDYLEEQVKQIKSNKVNQNNQMNSNIVPQTNQNNVPVVPSLSQEDYEKNVFTHQNEMARLTTDFTRTKKLKDIKIKSMYSFNGKDFVVLKLEDETNQSVNRTALKDELSANIEGRYVEGDYILGHKIISVNTRTKSLELYKQLDEEYGYTIFLSNYGISVSDLKKIPKIEEKKSDDKSDKKLAEDVKKSNKQDKIKEVFNHVNTKENTQIKSDIQECFNVNVNSLNVRNETDTNAKILRILRKNDQISVKQKVDNWIEIDTIYKKISGDKMNVSNQNNWVLLVDNNLELVNDSCK